MSDIIFINGLVLHAHHGVAEHETRVGQPFIIDLELEADLTSASRSDKLADTTCYDDIVRVTTTAFRAHNYRLVEAAAGAVADAILKNLPRVGAVRVSVRKPHAPIAAVFKDVGITLRRTRHG